MESCVAVDLLVPDLVELFAETHPVVGEERIGCVRGRALRPGREAEQQQVGDQMPDVLRRAAEGGKLPVDEPQPALPREH